VGAAAAGQTRAALAAITPLYRAFRLGMAAWELSQGFTTGDFDLAEIERQLSRTGTPPP